MFVFIIYLEKLISSLENKKSIPHQAYFINFLEQMVFTLRVKIQHDIA